MLIAFFIQQLFNSPNIAQIEKNPNRYLLKNSFVYNKDTLRVNVIKLSVKC